MAEVVASKGGESGDQVPASEVKSAVAPGQYQFHHFPQLDGFRGLAVIFVVLGHLLEWLGLSPIPTKIGYVLSRAGVLLFFVLSGFLITGLLLREKSAKGRLDLKRFYIRRALRLGPALVTFLLVILILRYFNLVQGVQNYEIAACLLYTRNFFGKSQTLTHIWSLSLEEQFYLCWPGTFALIKQKRLFLVTAIVTATIALWRGLAIHWELFDYQLGTFYMRPYFRFDSILIGAVVVVGLMTNDRFCKAARRFAKAVPASLLWVCLAVWSYYGEGFSRSNFITVQMLLIAAILCQLALDGSWISQAFFQEWVSLLFWKNILLALFVAGDISRNQSTLLGLAAAVSS